MVQRSGEAGRYLDAASALLVIATFSLIWRAWRIGDVFAIPIPIPELFILGIGFVLAVCALRSSLPRVGEFAAALIRQYWFLAVLLAAPLLGLFGSSLAGFTWEEYSRRAAIDYAFLLFAVFLFVIAAYIVFVRPRVVKPIFAAIAVSPVWFWLALAPSWQPFFLHADRLRGAGGDSNQLAAWIAAGLVASIVFFLWERGKVRWWWFANGLAVAPLLLWTASRSAWFTAAIVFAATGVLFLAEKFSRERIRLLGMAFIGIVASLILGFSLFPVPSRVVIATRAVGSFVGNEQLLRVARLVAGEAEVVPGFEIPPNNRTELLQEGARMFLRSPLGFGPVYYLWNPVAVTASGYTLGVHNTWLDVGLTAGWLGFGTWAFFMVIVGRGAVHLARRKEPQFLALAASFFTILLLGLFQDMFILRWLWLIMGLIIAYSFVYEEQKEA